MRSFYLFLFAFFLTSAGNQAFGWGCEGHQIVALLARVHLTPTATNAIDVLLRENPVNTANQYCKGGGDLMAEVASWADNIRDSEKTGLWHYVDIPLSVRRSDSAHDLSPWCESVTPAVAGQDRTGCVTSAIAYEATILSDMNRPSSERATALRYLIHFIGDMHQPLHASNNNDRGGNCTAIGFFGGDRPTNLHSIWDTRMLAKTLADRKLTVPQYATLLDGHFGKSRADWAAGNPEDWAWDSHKVAQAVTYGKLQPAVTVEAPAPLSSGAPGVEVQTSEAVCNVEREKIAALHLAITDSYYSVAMPVVDQQLAKGGYRLAAFLNSLLVK